MSPIYHTIHTLDYEQLISLIARIQMKTAHISSVMVHTTETCLYCLSRLWSIRLWIDSLLWFIWPALAHNYNSVPTHKYTPLLSLQRQSDHQHRAIQITFENERWSCVILWHILGMGSHHHGNRHMHDHGNRFSYLITETHGGSRNSLVS